MNKEIPARIYSLATTAMDSIIFLEEIEGIRILPIWIGPSEGQAIAVKFSGIPLPRPFTHDLMADFITAVGWQISKIVISGVENNTYYSDVHLIKDGAEKIIDARPSDAVALAVRFCAPIFVAEDVFSASQTLSKPISKQEVTDFKEKLKDLKPSDIINGLKDGRKEKDL